MNGPIHQPDQPAGPKERAVMGKKNRKNKPQLPATVRMPQDHQAKKPSEPELIQLPVQGLDLTIDRVVLDDFELLDDLYMVEHGGMQSALRLPMLLRRLFGDEQHQAIMDHLRDDNTGRVTLEAGVGFVGDVFTALHAAG